MREVVRDYYGQVLGESADLKTSACTTSCAPGGALAALMANVHPEVSARYYGCGLVFPPLLDGLSVLDLGCGSGRDCYVLAQLVGPRGRVVGVDMTGEQLEVARRHRDWHAERFGYPASNVEFRHGYIEQLDDCGLAPGSFDVVVSNCVINLAVDKLAVLRGAHRLLREGGELYFADVYASRRVPQDLAQDPLLYGECLGGALYWRDFERLARSAGFGDPRLVEDNPVAVTDAAIAERVDGIAFHSATCRLLRVDGLEASAEDYGQRACYRGGIADCEERFVLDKRHVFERGHSVAVSGNTFRLLAASRYADCFDLESTDAVHRGPFAEDDDALPFTAPGCCAPAQSSACC